MDEELLTKKQVAALLKVGTRTISYLTVTRQIPFIKGLGRECRYLKSSIMEWVKTKEIKPEKAYFEP